MNITQIAYERFLIAQKLYRFVDSEYFEEVYASADQALQTKLAELVAAGDYIHVKHLVDAERFKDLDLISITKLRELGKRYKIPFYYQMSRNTLIEAIVDARGKIKDPSEHNEGDLIVVRNPGKSL